MFVTEVSNLVDYITVWVPLTSISQIFLYLWPKVRSVPWPLHYKSVEKNANVSRSVCTHRNSPNLLDSWWFGTATMTKVRFLAHSLLKGHQRSLGTTNSFLSITFDWKEIECFGCHQDASTDMQHKLFRSLHDLDLRSNFDLNFSRSNYISFEASLREKHDGAIADALAWLVQKLFVKKYFAYYIYLEA